MPTKDTPETNRAHLRTRSSTPRVAVQWACRATGAPSTARLRAFVRAAVRGAAEITLRVVGGAEGRRLNRRYRGRDYATNVLSFHYEYESDSSPRRLAPLYGDAVLCHPVIVREARAQGKTLESHYAHLVVHAMLHLRGYDHQRPSEARRMERAELRTLGLLGFADPYLEPAQRPR